MADQTSEAHRAAFNGNRRVPPPVNEPVRAYAPGSPERAELKARLQAMAGERIDIPLVIGGKDVRTGDTATAVMPHDHRHVLADWHRASREHVTQAIEAARATSCRACSRDHALSKPSKKMPSPFLKGPSPVDRAARQA